MRRELVGSQEQYSVLCKEGLCWCGRVVARLSSEQRPRLQTQQEGGSKSACGMGSEQQVSGLTLANPLCYLLLLIFCTFLAVYVAAIPDTTADLVW